MKRIVVVTSKEETYKFIFLICATKSSRTRLIEDSFYINWSINKKVPTGLHHEIEVISPDLSSHPAYKKMHVHLSGKNHKKYVCFTEPLPDKKSVLNLLRMWTAGTVYTIENDIGFENLFTTGESTSEGFSRELSRLKEEYGIAVKRISIKK